MNVCYGDLRWKLPECVISILTLRHQKVPYLNYFIYVVVHNPHMGTCSSSPSQTSPTKFHLSIPPAQKPPDQIPPEIMRYAWAQQ